MGNLARVLKEIHKEQKQLKRLQNAIAELTKLVAPAGAKQKTHTRKRRLSAAARKKIAAAQRARWAKVRRKQKAA
jgi:peptidoglycan hydrolase CwlO-like protein